MGTYDPQEKTSKRVFSVRVRGPIEGPEERMYRSVGWGRVLTKSGRKMQGGVQPKTRVTLGGLKPEPLLADG